MQKMLTKGLLLDEKGNLNEAGYAFDLVRDYSRKQVRGLTKCRLKEWDYYFISDNEYGIALTIDDNRYMGMVSVSILDFKNKTEVTKSLIRWLTFGEVSFPSCSKEGDVFMEGKRYSFYFKVANNGERHLICSMKNVIKGQDFECNIVLNKTLDKSMVIATPFKKKKHFYYNQKINLLQARGIFSLGKLRHQFKKEESLGVLDWGRGVWTYSNTWYWSSLNANYNGHRIGFNLGYGFGDTSNASENMFFYDKEAFKLEDVTFNIPKDQKDNLEFLKEWTLTSNSGDINLRFSPIIDRYANTNALIIQSKQHQVFGYFSGIIKITGKEYKIENLLGFAEMVKNRW